MHGAWVLRKAETRVANIFTVMLISYFFPQNMVTSPVGALDCCQIWNHLCLTCRVSVATLVCIWKLPTKFLWFMGCRIHCKAVENSCLVLRTLRGAAIPPLFFWQSASFLAEHYKFWNIEPWTCLLQYPRHKYDRSIPQLLFFDLSMSFRSPWFQSRQDVRSRDFFTRFLRRFAVWKVEENRLERSINKC